MTGDRLQTPPICWRVRLRSAPDLVYATLDQPAGRRRFWARSAEEVAPGVVEFHFADGQHCRSQILERVPPRRFTLTYFDGSVVTFELESDGRGGTHVLLTEHGVPEASWQENHAGWVSVLLALKAAVDFDIDLRNDDPSCTWGAGYVDV